MNKYLEKVAQLEKEAISRSVKEILNLRRIHGHGSPQELALVKKLQQTKVLRSPEQYSTGIHKGNQNLITQYAKGERPANIENVTGTYDKKFGEVRGVVDKVISRLPGRLKGFINKKVDYLERMGPPALTMPGGKVYAREYSGQEALKPFPVANVNRNIVARHEINEGRYGVSKEVENFNKKRALAAAGMQTEGRTLGEALGQRDWKKAKDSFHRLRENTSILNTPSLASITNKGKRVGQHNSLRVLGQESNDVRVNPYSNVPSEENFILGQSFVTKKNTPKTMPGVRTHTGEVVSLRGVTGKQYGIDRFGRKQLNQLRNYEVAKKGNIKVEDLKR